MSKSLVAAVLAACSLAGMACTIDVRGHTNGSGVVLREQRRLTLSGHPNVTIRTFNGSVELRSWDRNEVLLDIERRADSIGEANALEVQSSEAGGNVVIEATHPDRRERIRFSNWTAPSVRLIVTVPRTLNVEARTGDGAVDARDIAGRIELRTGDGSVRLQRVDGDITVSTGDGSVYAREITGTVAVNTGDGGVEMSGRFSALKAGTGDGSIGIDVLPGSRMERDWTLTTGDGSMTIRLPPHFNAEVDAQTGDGSVTTTGVDLAQPRKPGERRQHVRGRVGAGGDVLTLRTGDGSINVVARQ